MPSVGSTPTTTSPSQLQQQHPSHHPKLQQQHSLPLQLQYHHHQPQVTTTQPSPAGTFINQAGIITTTAAGIGNGGDISPLSSSNSFSSVDTNQTLLNSIAKQTQQMQQQQQQAPPSSTNRTASNRSYRSKYSQFMIITPAVSIDRDFERETSGRGAGVEVGLTESAADNDADDSYFNNGNIFRMSLLQSSIDSGHSSDSSFRSNYNPYIHHSRQHLLPKAAPHFYTFSSWRWCTLICAAMRCFGGGRSSNAPYSTSFARPPYQRSRSSGAGGGGGGHHAPTTTPHRRLRSSSFSAETAYEHFSAPFTPRKTRDHMNNITYEL